MLVARLCIDFGLFILIWMVQLIVYPSFIYIDANLFSQWHDKYTGLISVFVVPLMFTQVGLVLYQFITTQKVLVLIVGLLVLLIWINTFLYAIPCHNKLQVGKDLEVVEQLIKINWWRTILWSLVCGISLYLYIKN